VAAVRECGLHPGVFSLLFGVGNDLGQQLVSHPLIKAGGFTGSRTGARPWRPSPPAALSRSRSMPR
jgi:NADP-dependent aldehyde dehydrogenase